MRLLITTCVLLVAAVISSCGGDKEDDAKVVLSQTKLTMVRGEEVKLTVSGVPEAVWTTEHDFVAEVYGGKVYAEHVGTTIISATYKNSTATCEVTVEPTSDLLPTPILKFGATPAQIRALEPGRFVEGQQVTGVYIETYDRGGRMLDYNFADNKLKNASRREYAVGLVGVTPALQERFKFVKSISSDQFIYYHPVDDYYVDVYVDPGFSIVYISDFDLEK